jgi:hypothetical protein
MHFDGFAFPFFVNSVTDYFSRCNNDNSFTTNVTTEKSFFFNLKKTVLFCFWLRKNSFFKDIGIVMEAYQIPSYQVVF